MSAPEATTAVADSKPIDITAAAPGEVDVTPADVPVAGAVLVVRLSPYLFLFFPDSLPF